MTIKSFLEKYKWLVIVLAAIPILVIVGFSICADWLHCIIMSGGDWATLIGAVLAYDGTVLLGLLAFWQNSKANETNKRLTQIQNQKYMPVLKLKNILIDSNNNPDCNKKAILQKPIAIDSKAYPDYDTGINQNTEYSVCLKLI